MTSHTDLLLTAQSRVHSKFKIYSLRLRIPIAGACLFSKELFNRGLALLVIIVVSSAPIVVVIASAPVQRSILGDQWLSLAGGMSAVRQQGDKEVIMLEPGKPLERELAGDGTLL